MPSPSAPLDAWIGRTQSADDTVALNAARRMAALLDHATASALHTGDSVPGSWYQILFSASDAQSALAADGHPAKGDFLPPVPLPRRMFAGRRVRFLHALRIGDAVTRTSTIQGITPKTGRSGEMCFVTVRHDIRSADGTPLIDEEQDIVYRAAPTGPAAASARADDLPRADAETSYLPDPPLLFRYSAITFNAHRIHYDLPYARDVEGYPDLVVNGGLTTMRLWDWVQAHTGRPLAASRSRNLRPLFAGRPVTLRMARTAADAVLAWAVDAEGEPAMRIEIALGAQA